MMKTNKNLIKRISTERGLELDNYIYISIWELASNVNNEWESYRFYPMKFVKRHKPKINRYLDKWAFEYFELHRLVKVLQQYLRIEGYELLSNKQYLKIKKEKKRVKNNGKTKLSH